MDHSKPISGRDLACSARQGVFPHFSLRYLSSGSDVHDDLVMLANYHQESDYVVRFREYELQRAEYTPRKLARLVPCVACIARLFKQGQRDSDGQGVWRWQHAIAPAIDLSKSYLPVQ
ncbi:hypothetical protein [Sphingobium sp. Z007]|uniref:hypothetical protein n=1 Tax=Sphingobium sp. Z007 TaxID=627495 RepID=UPI000B49F0A4|nr:hypothetical protein [Sphingobium sp. Z007]